MFIKEAHILIEQRLQNIGVFAHSEVHPEDVDLRLNTWMWKVMDKNFPNQRGEKLSKPKVDDYALLIEKEIEFPVIRNARGAYECTLPENFFHLIKGDSISYYECGKLHVTSGNIVKDEIYINDGGSINYNGVLIPKRSTFKGTTLKTYITLEPANKPKIYKLKSVIGSIRFVEEEFSTNTIEGSLSKPKPKSPIGTVAGEKVVINVDNFFIDKVYISYLKKPTRPNIHFKTYTKDSNLTAGVEYEVIEGEILYGNKSYEAKDELYGFPYFKAVSGQLRGNGNGLMRVRGDGDINLPYQVCIDIIDKVSLEFSVTSEQNPQKVNNIGQLNNI